MRQDTGDKSFPIHDTTIPSFPLEYDRKSFVHALGLFSIAPLGARVFLRIGQIETAEEIARTVLVEAKKVTDHIKAHRIIGIIAMRRGDAAAAEASFAAAMDMAQERNLPLLELTLARDLKYFVLEGLGRGDEAELLIDVAIKQMSKPKEEFDEVLGAVREW